MIRSLQRHLVVFEILTIWIIALVLVWWITPLRNAWLTAPTVAVFVALLVRSKWRRNELWRDWGFRFDNFFSAAKVFTLFAAGAMALLLLTWKGVGFPINSHWWQHPKLPRHLWEYPLWALAQQTVCLGFFARRFRELFPQQLMLAALCSALVFSSLHAPNFPLMSVCVIAGWGWARVFYAHPNLWTAALSHALLGIFLVRVLMMETRIGPGATKWEWLSVEGQVAKRYAAKHSAP